MRCSTVRTGRASIGLLDSVRVEALRIGDALNQVAQLHVPEPAMITVQPWDTSMLRAIEKAIRNADLGLNPGERRQDCTRADSAADGRTPARSGEEGEPYRRRAAGRHCGISGAMRTSS